MKLGFFGARSDRTGLGNQWVAMAKMLSPDLILLVNSEPFNGNKQFPERYEGFNVATSNGFPNLQHVKWFLQRVDVVLCIETPYTYDLFTIAQAMGKRVYLMINYEFWDQLRLPDLPPPYRIIAPSPWHFNDITSLRSDAVLLAPPVSDEDFSAARQANLARRGRRRFLHVVGKQAVRDRNGTLSVIEALKYTKSSLELVIKAQPPFDLHCDDPRVTVDLSNPDDQAELYNGFDCSLLPRRYGGLCLPVAEALLSALPVVMTDISPNNQLLPSEWLVSASKTDELMTRTMIDVYSADPIALAAKIDQFCAKTDDELLAAKEQAYKLGYENYSPDVLEPKYLEVLGR